MVVVGLGNPGQRFSGTRHNVGFDVLEAIAASRQMTFRKPFLASYEWTGRSDELILARPLTFMNRSGRIIPSLLRRTRHDIAGLVVVCDNLDLPVGAVRLKRRGESRSHNGIASVMDALGSGEFTRIYIGIGRPPGDSSVVDHVLGRPPAGETNAYRNAVVTAARAAQDLASLPISDVMNRLNRRA